MGRTSWGNSHGWAEDLGETACEKAWMSQTIMELKRLIDISHGVSFLPR